MAYKYKLLSIDGGGIRGIVPAKILAEIEHRTGKKICQMFDMIAGSSTGGILALGLTIPHKDDKTQPQYEAKEFIKLYRDNGQTIFPGTPSLISNLFKPKFSSQGRDEVLTKYFQDTQMKEALTNLIITSYDTELRAPIFFTNDPKSQRLGDSFRKLCVGYSMKEAAMATSAAPTYFQPHKIDTIDKTDNGHYTLIDGGVFANNPTNVGIIEALISSNQPGKEPLSLNDILIVSLGTGSLIRKYPYTQTRNWGLFKWVRPLINVVMDAGSESVAVQLEQLLPKINGVDKQYYRFQANLKEANDDMDDASPKNIEQLIELADLIIKQQDSALDELSQILTA